MASNNVTHADFRDKVVKEISESADTGRDLKSGNGSGTSDGMEGRVSRLEAHMEHVREDVGEIKQSLSSIAAKLDSMSDKIGHLPTKTDLSSWKLQWGALGLAVMAIVIGGIIGGLAWIQPAPEKPAPPAPIVITVPK